MTARYSAASTNIDTPTASVIRREASTPPRYSTNTAPDDPLATITPHVPPPTSADHRRRGVRAARRRRRRRGLVDRPRAGRRRAPRRVAAVHGVRADAAQHRPAADPGGRPLRARVAAV